MHMVEFKMRILNVFPDELFPVSSGSRSNTLALNNYLQSLGYKIDLASVNYSSESSGFKVVPASAGPFNFEVKIQSELCEPVWGLVKKFLNYSWVIFGGSPFSVPFFISKSNRKALAEFIQKQQYDIIIFHYHSMNRYLKEILLNDVKSCIFTHGIRYHPLYSFWLLPKFLRDKIEFRALNKYNKVIVVGDYERDIIIPWGFKSTDVFLCGVASELANTISISRREFDLLFVGGLSAHNSDAINFFLKEIWPKVLAARPSTTLLCVGSICSVPSLRGHPNVTPMGFVESLDAVYDEAELVINPVRIGQGVKVKVVEALARGCIVITTSNGAAGIHHKSEDFLLIDDDPKFWVDNILAYLHRKGELQGIRYAALEFSKTRFGNEVVFKAIKSWLHSSNFKNP